MAVSGMEAAAPAKKKKVEKPEPLKGNIRHSVSKWCFGSYPLDEFCEICKNIGIESIELLDPKDWPIVQKHGLTVAMAQGAGLGIDRGFNDPKLHDELVASYEQVIPMVAEAGLTNLICFAGRRNGVTDLQGWENCEKGLKRLMPIAEKYNVVLTMELLNSIGHKDYLCDHTVWGAELCRRIGSPNFKLLYDIYHMQIMEGNVIEHIRKYHQYFVTGHSEYDAGTLQKEYLRDKNAGLPIHVPENYFPDDDDTQPPRVTWRSHANLLFSNWLNYFVYQETPYDLHSIGNA